MLEVEGNPQDFKLLAERLRARRPDLARQWLAAVAAEPRIASSARLRLPQLLDHIPKFLDQFFERIGGLGRREAVATSPEALANAQAHGEERWRAGYRLIEVLAEWRHLERVLAGAIESECAGLASTSVSVAHRIAVDMCLDGMSESASVFWTARRREAQARSIELERALEHARRLEEERLALWREAAHDLHGNLSTVRTASAALSLASVPEDDARLQLLARGIESMHTLLSELLVLSRLDAEGEPAPLVECDVAGLVAEVCELARPSAQTRGLSLDYEGPATLVAVTEPVSLRRIVENLVRLAVTHALEGAVRVACMDAPGGRWILRVADGGVDPVPDGIALSIVRRLSDFLQASLEFETLPGLGTVATVSFPRPPGTPTEPA